MIIGRFVFRRNMADMLLVHSVKMWNVWKTAAYGRFLNSHWSVFEKLLDFVTAKAVDITADGLIGHLLEKSAKIVFTKAGVRTERVKRNRLFVVPAYKIQCLFYRLIFFVPLYIFVRNIFCTVWHHISDKLKEKPFLNHPAAGVLYVFEIYKFG